MIINSIYNDGDGTTIIDEDPVIIDKLETYIKEKDDLFKQIDEIDNNIRKSILDHIENNIEDGKFLINLYRTFSIETYYNPEKEKNKKLSLLFY